MMVVPEGGSLFEHNMTLVVDGHTGVEHSIPVARIYDDVTQLWKASKVGYTPDPDRRLRRPLGRELLVRQDRRLGGPAPRVLRAARGPRSRGRAAGSPRRDEEYNHFTTRDRRRLRARGVRVKSARTASARGWAPTGRCGCSRRGG